MSYLAALHAHVVAEVHVLAAEGGLRSLVYDVILLDFELLLVHQAQLLVLNLDTLIALSYVLQGVGALALHVGHFEHVLLIIRVAACGQEVAVCAWSLAVILRYLCWLADWKHFL
jgi:hypothetical protein